MGLTIVKREKVEKHRCDHNDGLPAQTAGGFVKMAV